MGRGDPNTKLCEELSDLIKNRLFQRQALQQLQSEKAV
jgi:hypothetical protein